MAILAYIELEDGSPKKTSLEAVTFASKIAENDGTQVIAVAPSVANDLASLGNYGASKVLQASLSEVSADAIADLLAQAVEKTGASTVVVPKSIATDLAAVFLATKIGAALGTNAIEIPTFENGLTIKKGVFSGKAFAEVTLMGDKKVITIKKSAVELNPTDATASVEPFDATVEPSKVVVKEVKKQEGDLLLTDADIVVSAGRGLKAPENWGMIEDLAKTLGAATGCSKPVSDMDWRPHHEHVGQTGIKVAPNLYVAIGISGAIQHLAGVSSSKTIVVINKDPEAPFFKSADYGIVGDAFEIIPKLNEALK